MDAHFKHLIEESYGFSIASWEIAPRQFVAEPYFLEDEHGKKYFAKITNKEFFIPQIIAGLGGLYALKNYGIQRIAYPVKTLSGDLYIMHQDTLIVLFDYIDAAQSYDYSFFHLGKLIAEIHQVKIQEPISIPRENFRYLYKEYYEEIWAGRTRIDKQENEVLDEFQTVLLKYESRIEAQYSLYQSLALQVKEGSYPLSITHNDSGGNVLVKSPEDLYLIDWDDLLLAPQERDSWLFAHEDEYLEGYRSVFPEYEVNEKLYAYYVLNYYFNSMAQYFKEIISLKSIPHKRENIHQLEHNLIEGWMKSYLIRIGAYT